MPELHGSLTAHRPQGDHVMLKRTQAALFAAAAALTAQAALAQELRIGLSAEPSSMDPHYHNLSPNNMLSRHIFEPLVSQDAKQALEPGLAESWKAINDTTWEFKLRKGVKFFDGSPFTADDVLATMKRAPAVPRSPSSFASFVAGMTFEKVDDHTIRVKTATPAPLVPTNLSTFGIVSKACAETMTTEDYNANKCQGGTGPFKLAEFKPGDRVVMERNDAFYGAKPAWGKVTFRFLTSAPTRVAAILSGDVDVIEGVPPTDMARLQGDRNLSVVQELSNRVIYFHLDQFRQTTPFITAKDGSAIKNPLLDKRVREALSKAINRPAIVERIMEKQAVPAEQVLPSIFYGTSKTLKPTEFDLAGARKLLADAGFPNGFKMKMHGPNGRYVNDTKIIEAVAQMFTRLGIDTEIETIPPANFFTRASTGGKDDAGATGFPEFSFILVGWGAGTGETSGSLRALLGTFDRQTGAGAANRGRYASKPFDDKVAEALRTVDDTKRAALLAEASEMGMKDFGIIPTHYQVNVWAARKGFKVTPRADEYSLAMGIAKE
jgi:peptide/nickel transport system substrate-binding protein